MNKYEKFKRISEAIIEIADLIKDESWNEYFQYQNGMKQFIGKEYTDVQNALFPQMYNPVYYPPSPYGYGYGQPQQKPWSSAWAPGSPVTQQRDIFDSIGATKLKEAMKKEEEDLDDATKFIESVTPLLPKGHLDATMPLVGEIIEAVRNKDYERAASLVKNNWIEGDDGTQAVPPTNSYPIPSWPPTALNEEPGESDTDEDDGLDDITD
jgi:hypothetical protein